MLGKGRSFIGWEELLYLKLLQQIPSWEFNVPSPISIQRSNLPPNPMICHPKFFLSSKLASYPAPSISPAPPHLHPHLLPTPYAPYAPYPHLGGHPTAPSPPFAPAGLHTKAVSGGPTTWRMGRRPNVRSAWTRPVRWYPKEYLSTSCF